MVRAERLQQSCSGNANVCI